MCACILFSFTCNILDYISRMWIFLNVQAVAALMGMKREMRDEHHVLDGWDINSVDPCTWYMVACSAEGFVISL